MDRKPYPTDVSDSEWEHIKPLVERPYRTGRRRKVNLREIVNALRYLLRAGCAWDLLPHEFPPHSTVWYYFRLWRDDGTFERLNGALRLQERERLGREPTPSAGSWDSQSVKTTEKGGRVGMMPGRK